MHGRLGRMRARYRQKTHGSSAMGLRTPCTLGRLMRAPVKAENRTVGWNPLRDPDGRFSSGIPDFNRLLGGGFPRGSDALFTMDESVGVEDLDLLLFPTILNFLYKSRGMIAILPSRDSPHGFRSRLIRYATRRRFDTRVRIVDYIGEDHGLSYVVNLADSNANPIEKKAAVGKMVEAERVIQGNRKHPFIELNAFEVLDTLMGTEKALKMFYYGIKRVRAIGNLGLGILGPGLGCSAGVKRLCDTEFALHREDVGLIVRGVRPAFPGFVVTEDTTKGPPHVTFVPRPN